MEPFGLVTTAKHTVVEANRNKNWGKVPKHSQSLTSSGKIWSHLSLFSVHLWAAFTSSSPHFKAAKACTNQAGLFHSSFPSSPPMLLFHPYLAITPFFLLPGDLWTLTPATLSPTHSKEHVPVPTLAHPQGYARLFQPFTLFFSWQGWLNCVLCQYQPVLCPPCTMPVPAHVYGTTDGGKDNSQSNAVSLSTRKFTPPAPRVMWLQETQILYVKIF